MTIQECFELLGDVDCISATLNTLFYNKNPKYLEREFKHSYRLSHYDSPLYYAFVWDQTEEGYTHWSLLNMKLEKLCAKK